MGIILLFIGLIILGNCKTVQRLNYRTACDEGNAVGCYNLGIMDAEAGKIDEAEIHFKRACERGDEEACNNLAKLEEGISFEYKLKEGPERAVVETKRIREPSGY